MSVSVENRPSRFRTILSAVLVVLVVVPAAVLFQQVSRSVSADIELTERERHGVEYLGRLAQLLAATSQAQAVAVAGGAPPEALAQALGTGTEVDQRLGAELDTRERWAALRAKIDALPAGGDGRELATYQAYAEVCDLLLALYRAVGNGSGLTRDRQADAFHLQQAAADSLPAAVVQASRLADLIAIAPRTDAAQRQQIGAALTVAVQRVGDAVEGLTDHLQAAADETTSGTLSSGVLGSIDRFRRGVDGIVQGARAVLDPSAAPAGTGTGSPAGEPAAGGSDPVATGLARLAAMRGEMQAAAGELTGTVLRETDRLLARRLDDLHVRSLSARVALAAAVLLALAAILVQSVRRRGRSGAGQPGAAGTPAIVDPARSATAGGGPPRTGGNLLAGSWRRTADPSRPGGNDVATARWERSDVAR